MMCLFMVILAFCLGLWAGVAGNWAVPLHRIATKRMDELEARVNQIYELCESYKRKTK